MIDVIIAGVEIGMKVSTSSEVLYIER